MIFKTLNKLIFLPIFLFFSVVNAQNNEYEKLYKSLNNDSIDSSTVQILNKFFFENYKLNTSKAAEIASIGLQIAIKHNDSLLLFQMQNLRALAILHQGTYFMALQIFFQNYQFFLKHDSKYNIAKTLQYIGFTYLEQNLPDISIQKFEEALKIFKSIGDSINSAILYRYLALAYSNIDNIKCKQYFFKSANLLYKFKQNNELAYTYYEMSNYFFENEQLKEAQQYINQALKLFNFTGNAYDLIKTYILIAEINEKMNNINEALKNYILAKNYSDEQNLTKLSALSNLGLAKVYIKANKYTKAYLYADTALQLSISLENYDLISKSYKLLAEILQKQGQKDKTIEYLKNYIYYFQKYNENKQSANISSFQLNLELQNIENNLTLYKMISEKEQLELLKKQYKKNIFFIVTILFLGLIFLIYVLIQMYQRKKSANELKTKNEQLNKEIEERKKAESEALTNEYRFRLLFSQTPIGIIQVNENLYINQVNEKISEILKKPANEILNVHINNIFDRKIVAEISKLFENKEETVYNITTEVPTLNEVVFISITIKKYHIWDNNQNFVGAIIIVQDLTEQKRTERMYNINVQTKQKLLKSFPDNLVLINQLEEIKAIHFPYNSHAEITASKLSDLFTDEILTIIRTNIYKLNKNKTFVQFSFSENNMNFYVRILPSNDNYLMVVTQLPDQLENIGIITTAARQTYSPNDYNFVNIQNDIKQELIPIYQNIQKGLSFLMIKNFAEKIIQIGKKYQNNRLIDYGEKLFDGLTSFNISKVNSLLDTFPSFIGEIIFLSNKI